MLFWSMESRAIEMHMGVSITWQCERRKLAFCICLRMVLRVHNIKKISVWLKESTPAAWRGGERWVVTLFFVHLSSLSCCNEDLLL